MYGMPIMTVGHTFCQVMPSGPTPMTPGITTAGGIVPAGTSHGDGMIRGGVLPTGDGTARCIGDGIVHGMADGLTADTIIISIRDGIPVRAIRAEAGISPTTTDSRWAERQPEAG